MSYRVFRVAGNRVAGIATLRRRRLRSQISARSQAGVHSRRQLRNLDAAQDAVGRSGSSRTVAGHRQHSHAAARQPGRPRRAHR